MRKNFFSCMLAAGLLMLSSCGQNKKPAADWLHSDDVRIAIDETFRPIMQDEMDVYSKRYPEATMKPVFCSENEAIRLLVKDSVRMALTTRPLNDNERSMIEHNLNLPIHQKQIASDALALIVNKSSRDTMITVDEIRGIVTGKITKWEQLKHATRKGPLKLVFDNAGSSTVRYMQDSICRGSKFLGNLYAQGNNLAVIEAVKNNPDIIGVVGANWLKDQRDTALASFDHLPFKVMWVSRFAGEGANYVQPFQYYIATGEYPLTRSVYITYTDPRTDSTTRTFFYFLSGQSGQLIICKSSQMLPYMPVMVKDVSISEDE